MAEWLWRCGGAFKRSYWLALAPSGSRLTILPSLLHLLLTGQVHSGVSRDVSGIGLTAVDRTHAYIRQTQAVWIPSYHLLF